MDYDKVKDRMGSWAHYMRPFIESDKFDNIFKYLREQSQVHKKILIPDNTDLFKSFEICDSSKVRAIVLLMDPYPTMREVKGKPPVKIANGIPIDCSNTGILQPSLEQYYMALTDCYDLDPDMEKRADISYLLKEEHVLLLNSSLTTELNKPGHHANIWKEFMEYLFEEVINKLFSGLPIVLCGAQAQRYEKCIDPLRHYILKVEHMAAAARDNRVWKHQDLFKTVNNIIRNNNGESECIRWYRTKSYQEEKYSWENIVKEGKTEKTSSQKEWDAASRMPWDGLD